MSKVSTHMELYGHYKLVSIITLDSGVEIRQSKINSRLVAGTMGQMNRRPSVWCSKYYIFFMISCRILCKNTFNLFVYFFKKNTKIKIKSFECSKSIKSLKEIILGTSDAWSTIRLSNRPSDPAWIYLRLTDFKSLFKIKKFQFQETILVHLFEDMRKASILSE